jgi:hypothetical protein
MMADAISGKLLTTDNIMPTHRPFLHSLGRKRAIGPEPGGFGRFPIRSYLSGNPKVLTFGMDHRAVVEVTGDPST